MERLLLLTLAGSVMALLLLILRRVLGKRLPSTAAYYAWLLVLLRFLLPLPGLVPTAGGGEAASLPQSMRYESTTYEEEEEPSFEDYAPVAAQGAALPLPAKTQTQAPSEPLPSSPAPAAARGIDWRSEKLRLGIWAAGAALSFGFCALSYALFAARLRRTLRRPDAFTRAVYEAMPGGKPALWRSDAVRTPLTYGLLLPKIVLPAGYCDEVELKNIFRHELTHYRRRDTMYKWFAAAVLSLHWFNPLAWLVRRAIDRDCELSCDEKLLRSMSREEKLSYGGTLLNMAASSALPAGVVATTFATEKKNLKERLEHIMHYKKSGARVLAAVLALLLLAGCGLAAGPRTGSGGSEIAVEPGDGNVVKVSTVDEFLAAIAPDTTIELAAGDYALAEASNYGGDSASPYYEWTKEYDGPALAIRNVDNLTLIGEGADKVTITAEPRYANVLRFVSCRNVTVAALTAGHTKEPGLCSGGVLRFEACPGVTVRQCGLFGCGTVGVFASDSSEVLVEDNAIYECSDSAVTLNACLNVRVTGGEVYGCGRRLGTGDAVHLFSVQNCSGVNISGVRIHDNSAQMLLHSAFSQGVSFLSNEVKDNRFLGAFALHQYSPTVDGCLFENNGDFPWYMYNEGVFAVDLNGNQLVGDAFEKLTLRELDPASVVPTAAPLPEGVKLAPGGEVSVKTVDELLSVIGPDRTIYLTGDSFDLSAASNYGSVGGQYYYWHQTYDGPELVIDGVKGLTIKAPAADPKSTTLSAVPRYANVLSFVNCEDLTLIGFTAGHTKEPGACSGGVLYFKDCHRITVDGMRLYGCGTLGVEAYNCTAFAARSTEIYECSQGGVSMNRTDGIAFVDCDVHDVPSPALSFYMCGDKAWNAEPLTGTAYDISSDGRAVECSAVVGGSLEEGDILKMSLEQLDAFLVMPEFPTPVAWPEGGAELSFAQTVRQLIADGDWEKLADRICFPLLLCAPDGNRRVESREDFLALDLDAILNESFRQRIGGDALEAMSVNAFGNGIVRNSVTFSHMEDKNGADVILIVAIVVWS